MNNRALFAFTPFPAVDGNQPAGGLMPEIGCSQVCPMPEVEIGNKIRVQVCPFLPGAYTMLSTPQSREKRLFMRQREWLPRTAEKVGGARKNAAH